MCHPLEKRVLSLLFFSLLGYRYLGDGSTDRREILHDGTYRSRTRLLPFWGQCPRGTPKSVILGLNFGHLTANMSKTVSNMSTELNISSTRALYNVSHGAVTPPLRCPPPLTRVYNKQMSSIGKESNGVAQLHPLPVWRV